MQGFSELAGIYFVLNQTRLVHVCSPAFEASLLNVFPTKNNFVPSRHFPFFFQTKHRENMRSAAVLNCEGLGNYCMPFASFSDNLIDIISGNKDGIDPLAATPTPASQEKDTSSSGTSVRRVINVIKKKNNLTGFLRNVSLIYTTSHEQVIS